MPRWAANKAAVSYQPPLKFELPFVPLNWKLCKGHNYEFAQVTVVKSINTFTLFEL